MPPLIIPQALVPAVKIARALVIAASIGTQILNAPLGRVL